MEVEEKGGGRVEASSLGDIARSLTISLSTLSHPALCERCESKVTVFEMPGHPDDGVPFTCGILQDNMKAGCMAFHCPYFVDVKQVGDKLQCTTPDGQSCMCQPADHPNGKVIAEIIDAEKANEALRLVEIIRKVVQR